MGFIISMAGGKACAMAGVAVTAGACRTDGVGRIGCCTVRGAAAVAVAVVTCMEAAVGAGIDMAVFAVVVMDVKSAVQVDHVAGMAVATLCVGADPRVILNQMRREVGSIVRFEV